MPAMWTAPRLGTTWRLRSLKISSCAVAKESAQAGRTLALFSLELSRQAFFPRGFHGPALSLELALRQSWFISTPMPFRVDLTKSRMTIWDAGDETLMELHVSHPKHPVPPRSVADVARITTNRCTDLIAMIKEVSTQTRKNKSDDDIVDGELLVNSMSKSDKLASIVVSVFGTDKVEQLKQASGNRWRSSTYR